MFSMCYVTSPSREVAKKLAHLLVSQKAAACVNIVPGVTSVYSWKGAVEEDEEVLLLVKTQTHLVDNVISIVKENHPYDCPEIVSVPMGKGSPDYLDWVKASTSK
ncbi:periplasmic divalent cation tolerance protein [Angomonas deanei]|uniref:CutA1 divalent ion tolerance protein, putative n=1 Tax=Angomonas deanei TaxID=59799 RepID=S9WT37_9TRYP|nr:periplasmic divalent cation tolerance protein [Angomonas deanei]EPY39643.1 periplasmic divalent cation tolerance protein [Angomonas deanei]CAD2212812.1 CutA1 divalent ion tolerance protein, putative [Angomonas deanei]|eukprot:EPY39160.1 periplasmic divalent cation tolerance protein [Angomonas deanei]